MLSIFTILFFIFIRIDFELLIHINIEYLVRVVQSIYFFKFFFSKIKLKEGY